MLFIVIERFKGRDPTPIYARLREQGRGLPEGLRYVDSWVEVNFDRCFQLMETDDTVSLQRWVLRWGDLAEFEIVPVSPSRTTRDLFPPAGEPPPDLRRDGLGQPRRDRWPAEARPAGIGHEKAPGISPSSGRSRSSQPRRVPSPRR